MKRRMMAFLLTAVWASSPALASAHTGAPPAPHDLWRAWNLDPVLLIGLTLTGWLYLRGVAVLWERAGRGRGVKRWQVASFMTGLLLLFVALCSPLDALTSALFSAHMAQHLILVLAAPPLLILGGPLVPFLWAIPGSWRRRLTSWSSRTPSRAFWRWMTVPAIVLALQTAVLWLWHMPSLYEAALANEPIHVLEHATLFVTALLFWWIVIQPYGRRRLSYPAGVLVVFAAGLQATVLGALITFAGRPWYPTYATTTTDWGLSALADQQVAGLLMSMPMGVIYWAVAMALLAACLRQGDHPAISHDQAPSWPSFAHPDNG